MATSDVTIDKTNSDGSSFLIFKDPAFPVWTHSIGSLTASAVVNVIPSLLEMPQEPGERVDFDVLLSRVQSTTTAGTWPARWHPDTVLGNFNEDPAPWVYIFFGTFGWVQVNCGGTSSFVGGSWFTVIQFVPTFDRTAIKNIRAGATSVAGASTITFRFAVADTLAGGWFRPVCVECITAPTTVTVCNLASIDFGWTSGGTILTPTASTISCFYPLVGCTAPELTTSHAIYSRCRLNGFSLLASNTTARVNKEGKVVAAVFTVRGSNSSTHPFKRSNLLSGLPSINVRQRYTGMLEKGFYTYVQPQYCDDKFTEHYYYNAASSYQPLMNLDKHKCFTFIDATCAANSQTLLITADWQMESLVNSQLYSQAVTTVPYEELRQIEAEALNTVPVCENPLHLSAMARAVQGASRVAWRAFKPYANPLAHRAVDYILPVD
jgi:hypothetical protein